MLCDDIIADEILQADYDGLDAVCAKIARAQKFMLSKDFAAAADGLVDNHAELRRIVPYCRTPHPLTWIEFLHDERPHWDCTGPYKARAVDPSRHQLPPQRVGFLLEQEDDEAKVWLTHLFWSAKVLPPGGVTKHNGSLGSIRFDLRRIGRSDDALIDVVIPAPAQFGQQLMQDLGHRLPAVVNRLLEYTVEDWGGETRFLVSVLGLLNARNVVELESVDHTEWNAKRERKGQRPLFSHKILKIRPAIYRSMRASDSAQHHDVRMHFVRGHWKHRRSGLFWWRMHTRGKIDLGFVDKDYEVI